MPGFDGTGPEGRGSMTGRGLGNCNPNTQDQTNQTAQNQPNPRPVNRFFGWFRRGTGYGAGFGRGMGRGMGRGLGRGRGRGFRN